MKSPRESFFILLQRLNLSLIATVKDREMFWDTAAQKGEDKSPFPLNISSFFIYLMFASRTRAAERELAGGPRVAAQCHFVLLESDSLENSTRKHNASTSSKCVLEIWSSTEKAAREGKIPFPIQCLGQERDKASLRTQYSCSREAELRAAPHQVVLTSLAFQVCSTKQKRNELHQIARVLADKRRAWKLDIPTPESDNKDIKDNWFNKDRICFLLDEENNAQETTENEQKPHIFYLRKKEQNITKEWKEEKSNEKKHWKMREKWTQK